jgi:hypothetical protein
VGKCRFNYTRVLVRQAADTFRRIQEEGLPNILILLLNQNTFSKVQLPRKCVVKRKEQFIKEKVTFLATLTFEAVEAEEAAIKNVEVADRSSSKALTNVGRTKRIKTESFTCFSDRSDFNGWNR